MENLSLKARLHDRAKMARARQKLEQFNSFYKETVNFYPFRDGSIGAYGPVAERIKVHCFFVKTVGTVPVFIGPVPFFFCRVNAPLFHGLTNSYNIERYLIRCGCSFPCLPWNGGS